MKLLMLRKGETRRLEAGHRWVFSNEIGRWATEAAPGAPSAPPERGELVTVRSAEGEMIGLAHANPNTLIAARLLGGPAEAEGVLKGILTEADVLAQAVRRAVARRQPLRSQGRLACRIVFGESDDLPGLVADLYGQLLCVQILTAGMARTASGVLDALQAATGATAVYEKTSGPYLEMEGLVARDAWLRGDVAWPVELAAGGGAPAMAIELPGSQKTGAFLDQHDNRVFLAQWLAARVPLLPEGESLRVVDLFCYHGHWSLASALASDRVTTIGVDSSEPALEAARRDAALNGLGARCTFERGDVFDWLEQANRRAERGFPRPHVVVCDPPAFAKARKSVGAALKAYERLNAIAARLVAPGGLLISCSCSWHVEHAAFRQLLVRSMRRAGRRARIAAVGAQASDHPILVGMEETDYLKMVALEFLDA